MASVTAGSAHRVVAAKIPLGRRRLAAARLGCSESHLSHIIAGRRLPGRDLADRIRELYGIPISAWRPKGRKGARP